MKRATWVEPAAGAVALLLAVGAPPAPAGADDAADPVVVAQREAAANPDPSASYRNPPPVGPASEGVTTSFSDVYLLSATSTSGGYIEVAGRDNPAQDDPGILSTTLRVYGNAAAFRSGAGSVSLNSQFTCSGAGISSLTVGGSGWSVSGGVASSTLTWTTTRSSATEARQFYTEGGHFRCKASNATAAKFTRRGTATAAYKATDTRAQDDYSFWW